MIGAMQDVTQAYEARQALAQSEARFRQLAEATPMIVWEADAQGNTTYLSPRWSKFTNSADGLGLGWKEFVHPTDQQGLMDAWQQAVRTAQPFSHEMRLRVAATGEYRWHLDRAVPVLDAQGQVLQWVGAATDIQEQKQLLEQLESAYSDLEAKVAFRNFDLEQQVRELRQQLGNGS
jgi:PAS domain S-box-containing protein